MDDAAPMMDLSRFVHWAERGKPGDSVVYFEGDLGHAREKSFYDSAVNVLARRVYDAYAAGRVLLVQRRIDKAHFAYIAIRTSAW